LSSFDSNLYNHNVTLIEHTKLLEKYLVNGKTFTQPLDQDNIPLYTLYDVVETLRTTVLFERDGSQDIFAPFTIPDETKDELENIISPEFSFKDVTLRQALDEVGNVINAICRLNRDNELLFDKFNELLDEIDSVTENYVKQQDINNYSTILSSDVINPINQDKDNLRGSEYFPGKNLWTTLRSDFGRFDFEQAYIPTPKPIYEVTEAKTLVNLDIRLLNEDVTVGESIFDNSRYELDITRNIVEKNKYDTLRERVFLENITEPDEQTNYNAFGFFDGLDKRTVVYYEYGKPNINIGKTYGIFNVSVAYRRM